MALTDDERIPKNNNTPAVNAIRIPIINRARLIFLLSINKLEKRDLLMYC